MAVSPSTEPPKKRPSSILGSLREAIKKVRFLLSSSATRWMLLSSIARGGGRATPRRGISFNSPRPGLLDVEGSIVSPSPASSRTTSRSASMGTATTRSVSRTSSARTSSGGSPSSSAGDDDIDRRAEQFIANFYRQLQMERQVSLQLRYIRGNSWERTP
ncbi:uncharacterized protein LOC133895654 [Phragmites australis]|uniref:uncharacterized protein LOC133895654 n=1 Tax=Phragmites australis TaxID=29695 RepID=UPI002D77D8E4|nr:uncharacterized protein LOC133895654 [Phragmites australis]